MADRLRYRHGAQKLVKVAVDSATVIEAGDLVFLDTDDAKPVSSFAWDSNLATTQASVAAKFLGVAQEPSASGETDEISVDISPDSVYEFQAASGTYEIGDPVGPDHDGSETLLDQTVESAVAASSIGRVMRRETATTTKVLVSFASAYHVGANNVNNELG